MTPEQIQQLIDQLLRTGEFLATEAFRIALRQVYLKLLLDSISAVAFGIAGFLSFKSAKESFQTFQKYLEAENGWTNWRQDKIQERGNIFLAISIALAFAALLNVFLVISYAINPEWYAIKLLLDMFS